YGGRLSESTAQATAQPLPTNLGGVTLSVIDSTGVQRSAPLIFVSPAQINFVVPDGTAAGAANFIVTKDSGNLTYSGTIQTVAPALFSMNGTGAGVGRARPSQRSAHSRLARER